MEGRWKKYRPQFKTDRKDRFLRGNKISDVQCVGFHWGSLTIEHIRRGELSPPLTPNEDPVCYTVPTTRSETLTHSEVAETSQLTL